MTAQVEAIDKRLEELRAELANVSGKETEVYTRIVGYYRSVRNWNKGKKAEYHIRTPFVVDNETVAEKVANPHVNTDKVIPMETPSRPVSNEVTYTFFYRNTCPNCPPVKSYLESLDMGGEYVNADSEEGMKQAQEFGVMAAPTVIFFNGAGEEIYRTGNVQGLKDFAEPQAVAQM